jgi:hypothetical protein
MASRRWWVPVVFGGILAACSLTSSLDDLKGGTGGGGPDGGGTGGADGSAGDGAAATGNTGGGTAEDGSACGDAGECKSGYCVDGVCCASACDGACQACTSGLKGGGVDGECGPAQDGTDPRNDCTDEGVASCGNDGRCDGKGACRKYAAGTECAGQTCSNGVKYFAKTCNGAGSCAENGTQQCQPASCNGIVCTGDCASDNECQSDEYCDIASGDCTKKAVNGTTCQTGKASQCQSGFCVEGVCCDTACSGTCQSCVAAFTGGADGTCAPVADGTDPDGECADQGSAACGTDGLCDGKGACRKYSSGTVCSLGGCSGSTKTNASTCNAQGQCQSNGTTNCAPYLCQGNVCGTSCTGDTQCTAGNVCDTTTGSCGAKKDNGTACTSGSQCASGFCVDGVCCESACTGSCKACSTSKKGTGADGVCGNVANGLDPDADCGDQGQNSCGTNGSCDGNGGCALYPTGTQCAAQSCSGSTQTNAKTCNGAGTCSGTTTNCSPYQCSGNACGASCTSSSQCVSGYSCVNNNCGTLKGNGSTCSSGAECSSGNCADGYCCNVACSGTCEACSAAKSGGTNGTCKAIPDGNDPDNECATQAASTCGTSGACNGASACAKYPAGTVCVAASCAGSTLTAADTCNGSGACVDNGQVSCAPYICSGTSCKTSCATGSDCATGYYCGAGNTCLPGAAPNGTPCTTPSQCASGFCVDSFCCDTSCTGLCKSCDGQWNIWYQDGKCGNIDCADPDNECAGNYTCTGNGKCGTACL